MSDERLRELERAHRADPQDLVAIRELADERKRLGMELVVRCEPWLLFVVRTFPAMLRGLEVNEVMDRAAEERRQAESLAARFGVPLIPRHQPPSGP